MKFSGRILILSDDAAAMSAQLAGADLGLEEASPRRSNVSTDEITPLPVLLNFDETLGRYAHTGTVFGGVKAIGEGTLARGGFSVLVAGKRYGKGSSREHSPLAERSAGIRLVIAESFERIYRQNCDNLGIFTSSDFGLIDRIRAGEDIPLEELVAGRDSLASAILREGGLLSFGERHLAHARPVGDTPAGPQTLAQKIVARARLQVEGLDWDMRPGTGGFVRADWRFIHEYYTGMAAHMLHDRFGRPLALRNPGTILLFEDHLSYSHRSPTHLSQGLLPGVRALSQAHRAFEREYGLKSHGYLVGEEGSEGISHAMMTELYALPGQLIVGTDSHTTHLGAVGCFAYGIGTTDMANAFVTGACRLTMAESLLVRLEGELPPGVSAKDVALTILASSLIREGGGLGKIFEFAGPVIDAMSVDARATLTNMVAEMGGLTGICAPDATTVAFLRERRAVDFQLEDWMQSDPEAIYADVLTIDCSRVGPMLASPGDPGNGLALETFSDTVHVDIAYGGSCTAGKRDDFDAYHEVAQWAFERGLSVPPETKLYLQCGTLQVRDYCEKKGYMDAFRGIGAEILGPSCGACGQCGPGVSTDPGQVTISAINRNFPGRGGPGTTWLASPATVVASAIAGKVCGFANLRAAHPE
ncbi:aconitase family protein [Solirhodobacter olei]|uniref:aconitase family protein n=1 Tax=Solirhodobacter olei TaxID=2493082 RepID=UPI000FD92A0C|nr:aconitase family protein [Solirhodobacter olei]